MDRLPGHTASGHWIGRKSSHARDDRLDIAFQGSAPPAAAKSTVAPIDSAILIGTWHASREDGSKFELTLTKDATFEWKFTLKGKVEEFGGTYKYNDNALALERKDGGALIAGLVPDGTEKFNFKLLGAPKEDPGLAFSR